MENQKLKISLYFLDARDNNSTVASNGLFSANTVRSTRHIVIMVSRFKKKFPSPNFRCPPSIKRERQVKGSLHGRYHILRYLAHRGDRSRILYGGDRPYVIYLGIRSGVSLACASYTVYKIYNITLYVYNINIIVARSLIIIDAPVGSTRAVVRPTGSRQPH